MSEYFLADRNAEERARQRAQLRNEPVSPAPKQQLKISLLGDFMFPSSEPPGCDPYNSVQGKTLQDAWKNRRERR
jgi:hypothetical protein